MKLVIAIINKSDSKLVVKELMKGGFLVTKMSSAGGFLKVGTSTLFIGTHAERVEKAIDIIKSVSKEHKYVIGKVVTEQRSAIENENGKEIVVGGATVFVVEMEQILKI